MGVAHSEAKRDLALASALISVQGTEETNSHASDWLILLPGPGRRWVMFVAFLGFGALAAMIPFASSDLKLLGQVAACLAVLSGFSALWSP